MSNIACFVCREIIAVVDYKTLSLPLTPEQFKSPYPERGTPDPFPKGLQVPSWKCPYCNSYPIYGYEAGLDTLPYKFSEFKNNKFIDVAVKDILTEQGQRKRSAKAMREFQKTLIAGLKKQPRIYKSTKKTYKCGSCGMTFNHASSLSRHKKKKGHK